MQTASSPAGSDPDHPSPLSLWLLLGPAFYIFIVPFAQVAALRSTGVVLTLICGLLAWRQLRRESRLPPQPLTIALALWVAAALLSLPAALNFRESLREIKGDVLYSLAIYCTAFFVTTGARAFCIFRRTVCASLLLLSSLAIISYLNNQHWWVNGYQNALGEYATTVTTVLPLIVTAFFPQRIAGPLTATRLDRILAALTCIAAGIGTYCTLSRGVWLVAALIIVAFLIFAAVKRLIPRWLVLIGVVFVIGGAFVVAERVAEQRSTELTSLHGREAIYAVAWEEFKKHPLTGVGYGRESNRKVYLQTFPQERLRHAHNVVLSWGEQMGIPGIAAIFVLFGSLIAFFARLPRVASASVESQLLCVSGMIFVCATFLKNMTDMFFANETLVLFFGMCGVFIGYCMRLPRKEKT